ncbi:MAG: NADH-quinone oxidoreductase subunit, partial [Marmoricola sp.]|nr:NADH-quinone oxidoreductase subunit [Marmoricola sp.]
LLGFYPRPLIAVLDPVVKHTMSQVGTSDPRPSVTSGEAAK